MRTRTLAVITSVLCAGGANAQAAAQAQDVPIQQWHVPYEKSTPRDPSVAPDGRIWFVGQIGNYIAVFDPRTAEFKKWALPDTTYPHSNVVAPDGMVWISGNRNGTINRLDPTTGDIKVFKLPPGVNDPHTMVFDGKGGMWFTSQQSHYVGHFNLTNGQTHMIKTSEPPARTNPYGIILDDKGRPWFDLFATNKIGTIDPATFELKTFDLPDPAARPRRIARTSDGSIWYTDYTRGFLGRLDPKTGKVEEFANPSGAKSRPYAMTVDDADRVWYVETGVVPNRMVAFDPKSKKVVYNAAVPGEGPNTIRHMVFDPKTRQIWYGADLNFLGSVKVPAKPSM
jgi:virginiamycin B lyase